MKHVSNEQMAKKIAEESKQYFYHDEYECGFACAKRMAKLKDEQHAKEKQQLIDKAWDWLTNQKGEHTKEDFIKAMEGE